MYDEFLLLLLITFSDSSLFFIFKTIIFFVYFKLLMAFPQPAVSCSTKRQLTIQTPFINCFNSSLAFSEVHKNLPHSWTCWIMPSGSNTISTKCWHIFGCSTQNVMHHLNQKSWRQFNIWNFQSYKLWFRHFASVSKSEDIEKNFGDLSIFHRLQPKAFPKMPWSRLNNQQWNAPTEP
jgi:hypothetical protein